MRGLLAIQINGDQGHLYSDYPNGPYIKVTMKKVPAVICAEKGNLYCHDNPVAFGIEIDQFIISENNDAKDINDFIVHSIKKRAVPLRIGFNNTICINCAIKANSIGETGWFISGAIPFTCDYSFLGCLFHE